MLEDFLEKLKNLTPLQTSASRFSRSKFQKRQEFKILKETKILHQKRKDLSKIQIIEFSILFIILNNFEIASQKTNELSKLEFISEKNQTFKNFILELVSKVENKTDFQSKISENYKTLVDEIKENSNIQLITKDKNDQEILQLLDELIADFREQNNLRRIESLEKKLIDNLDENSYSEFLKLKSQLNRD